MPDPSDVEPHHSAPKIPVKSGDKIAFFGDSITNFGWRNPHGYVRLVMAGLRAIGIDVEAIAAGRNGERSNDLLARLESDVLSHQPQWMLLSCGINDIHHGKFGVPLDETMAANGAYAAPEPHVAYFKPYEAPEARGTYQGNIRSIAAQARSAGMKVMLLTTTVIQEKLDSPGNIQLGPYNEFLRTFAREENLLLADLNALFQARFLAEASNAGRLLTIDGVHMNPEGDKIIANGVLEAFGFDSTQLAKAHEAWAASTPTSKS